MKTVKSCIPNILAAVIIFLIPTFVDIVAKTSFPNSDYSKCISGISKESVGNAYYNKMESLVSKAEEELTQISYSNARAYLSNITDNDKRKEYESRLETVYERIQKNEGNSGNSYAKVNYSNFKWTLYYSTKGPANKYYSNVLPYAVWAPENVSDLNGVSLPLIIWLHGAGELSYNISLNEFKSRSLLKVVSNWKNTGLENIPAIIMAPQAAGHWASRPEGRDKNISSIKALIESAKEIYNVDTSNVVLMGHSLGSRGVTEVAYEMRKKYSVDYFNKLVMFSGGHDIIYPSKTDEKARLYFSAKQVRGYAEPNTATKDFFDWVNKPESFTLVSNSDHGTVVQRAMEIDENKDGVSDLVYWLFGKNEGDSANN